MVVLQGQIVVAKIARERQEAPNRTALDPPKLRSAQVNWINTQW
jgi:hypothetical protein